MGSSRDKLRNHFDKEVLRSVVDDINSHIQTAMSDIHDQMDKHNQGIFEYVQTYSNATRSDIKDINLTNNHLVGRMSPDFDNNRKEILQKTLSASKNIVTSHDVVREASHLATRVQQVYTNREGFHSIQWFDNLQAFW